MKVDNAKTKKDKSLLVKDLFDYLYLVDDNFYIKTLHFTDALSIKLKN